MQTNEQKICSFSQKGTRLQLIQVTTMCYTKEGEYQYTNVRYQVRLNRKIIDTSISEYQMRRVFTAYCQSIVLQLKIL